MLLAQTSAESKKCASYEETTASRIAEGGKEHWDIPQLEICSTCDNSKQLQKENTSESVRVDASGCGALNVDHAAEDSEGLACSSQSVNENVTPGNAEDGNDSNGDEPHDDDFSPKDLLRFAWQIARGMVNNVLLFFRVSLERWLMRFKVFIIIHYFNGLQQKEITIYKKSNIKTALNYINAKSKMSAVTRELRLSS